MEAALWANELTAPATSYRRATGRMQIRSLLIKYPNAYGASRRSERLQVSFSSWFLIGLCWRYLI